MKTRGTVIEEARIRLGLTRSQLADEIDISYQHLYNLERGFHGASEAVLAPIADRLGLDFDQVADRDGKNEEPDRDGKNEEPDRKANPTKAPEPARPIPPPNPSKTPAKTQAGAA